MTTPTIIRRGDLTATLYCGDCLEILPTLTGVDCTIADPPFSERTHSGHDSVELRAGGAGYDNAQRSSLGYKAWDESDVARACLSLPESGWACFISDHTLAREWEKYLNARGRYVFAPVPIVTPGRSVRLSGDGPSSWTDWMVVSRTAKEAKWGTLPGFYQGRRGTIEHMGGKPLCVMQKIVRDYSREGTTVMDICMGSGTTGVACLRTGRNFIGIEIDPDYFKIACERIDREARQGVLL